MQKPILYKLEWRNEIEDVRVILQLMKMNKFCKWNKHAHFLFFASKIKIKASFVTELTLFAENKIYILLKFAGSFFRSRAV